MSKTIQGFSKLSKIEKIEWLAKHYLGDNDQAKEVLFQYWNEDEDLQQLHDEFIENTISNYYLPLGIAPNFVINNKTYAIPMAIEESSVVAAASKAAKFWAARGGFTTTILGTVKVGHVHFTYTGKPEDLQHFFTQVKPKLLNDVKALTASMEKRGGGILDIALINKTEALPNYYQLYCTFETKDAMGANFINSCLEQFASTFSTAFEQQKTNATLEIIMSILSNYTPECLVRAKVSCAIAALKSPDIPNPVEFAHKFYQAVQIARVEPYRAVTHNKGIMNGVDAVILATGNDFRAIEAGAHAYASKLGSYSSLSHCSIDNGIFEFWIELPLALGTVGGLTKVHPLVKLNLELLNNPTAPELMQVVAVAGLAQNFAAVKSLTTTGIQKGHMKMHLMNILNQLAANPQEKEHVIQHFTDKPVSFSAVQKVLEHLQAKN